jgi:membrane protein
MKWQQSLAQRHKKRHRPLGHRRPGDLALPGWLSVVRAVGRGMGRHQVSIDAAAISFMALFAIFSTLAAFVAFYGLWADPKIVVKQMQGLGGFVPADVVVSMVGEMQAVAERAEATLWTAGLFSAAMAFWCAQQGIGTLIVSLNAAYGRPRAERGWVYVRSSLTLAVMVIAGLVWVASLAMGLPIAVQILWHNLWWAEWARAVGMALGGLFLFFGLTALYRWVPDRPPPDWRWVWPGACLVVAFWTIASSLFSVFLAYSNSYSLIYGSLSAVMLLLTLTYVTVASLLVGVEFNAQLEAHCDALDD